MHRGNWRGGRANRGASSRHPRERQGGMPDKEKPCRFFQKTGSCRFGFSCNFSHDLETHARANDRPEANTSTSEDADLYSNWKYLLKKNASRFGFTKQVSLNQVWSDAVEILNRQSHEHHQLLAKDLVDDKFAGIEFVHLTLRIRINPRGPAEFNVVEDFLKVITHASLLDCLSIDTYVGTLYNIISGAGGERAVPFFLYLSKNPLRMLAEDSGQITIARLDRCFTHMLEALSQLLRREKRASFHQDVPELLDCLDEASVVFEDSGTPSKGQGKKGQISVLRKIVGLATGLLKPSPEEEPESPMAPKSAPSLLYPMELPLPGGHHDNDHRDITEINLIPTAEELLSDHLDYLPSTDFRQPHFLTDPVQRYLDTHFRLLRYDVFGPLKTALGSAVLSLNSTSSVLKLSRQDVSAHLYSHAFITHLSVHDRRGFEIHIEFDLPPQARKKSKDQRKRWWENSKRLESGSLICLLAHGGRESDEKRPLLLIVTEKCTGSSSNSDAEGRRATVTAKLASLREDDMTFAMQLYRSRSQGTLVAIPGLIPATFIPILENLQETIGLGTLPFHEWVIPRTIAGVGSNAGSPTANIPPPAYARQPTFTFDLTPIMRAKGKTLTVSAASSSNDDSLLDKLEVETTLDRGQCRALLGALTREFALIQGPPGTGKSYLGVKLLQVLLACKRKAGLGPIVVICYTNHALDQFLTHLLHVGINKIIRIGGQSKTPELEGYNLRVVSSNVSKTRHEAYIVASTYEEINKQTETAGKRLGTIHKMRKGSTWEAQKRLIQESYPWIYAQLYRQDDDAFTLVGRDPLEVWLDPKADVKKTNKATRKDTKNVAETTNVARIIAKAQEAIHSLSLEERRIISKHWVAEVEKRESERLFMSVEDLEASRRLIDMTHREVNRRSLLTADVIGITTTGLARDASMLRNLRSKVVVCEEAGEVLEAHVISAMMPSVQHCIQIGDHQQLRPQINNYSLSLESKQGMPYQLDRSQFERLAMGQQGLPKIPVAQLDIQRRMRPDVAKLIRPLYPALQDHGSVLDLPHVVGMKDNVFWLNHFHVEDGAADDGRVKSHSNEWEVGMTKALVRHLVRQGVYKGTDIAVLTPYSGQLYKLREALNSDFDISLSDRDEDVLAGEEFELEDGHANGDDGKPFQRKRLLESLRLATVDNFQGEEAKIIIVSLVRSNPEGKVGFLRTVNRINVLLSRAQHGMYLIGSADTYANVPMWVNVREQLEEAEAVGDSFRLCCPRHKDTPIECSEPEDFVARSPEGGCSLPCEWRLEKCGHQCLAKCHSNAMHSAFLCPRPCARSRATCQHVCPKLCGEACGPCLVLLDGITLPCGHQKNQVACFKMQELSKVQCNVEVNKKVDSCGHVMSVPCHVDVNLKGFRCPQKCDRILKCGHVCPGSCGTCTFKEGDGTMKTQHKSCNKRCQRPHSTCNHLCDRPCHADEPCPLCSQSCEVLCDHSKCTLQCAAPCAPCIEKCPWRCEHQGACTMPCAAPCNRLPCNKRCVRRLDCGHQCPGLCGEPCPEKHCQTCSSKGDARVDLLEFKTYSEISLDNTPIVALTCGHFFTAESLDGLVSLNEMYSVDSQGEFNGLSEPSVVLAVPKCPDCKRPIRQHATRRYNRVVNIAVMDETSKRFLVKGQTDLQNLEQRIDEAATKLRSLDDPKPGTTLKALSTRYKELETLRFQMRRLAKAMEVDQQPARKLHDAILLAKHPGPVDVESVNSQLADMSLHAVQSPMFEYRTALGCQSAHIRVQDVILQDWLDMFSKALEDDRQSMMDNLHKSTRQFFAICESVIQESTKLKLHRYTIQASLSFARLAKRIQASFLNGTEDREHIQKIVEKAKELLDTALDTCDAPFEGSKLLKIEVEDTLKMFRSEWFEPVTKEEIEAIKSAMLGGLSGMATHSGHWYKCQNGHTFAIGECGMPMELARCPECGAQIGGQNHTMVSGMTRAEDMEG